MQSLWTNPLAVSTSLAVLVVTGLLVLVCVSYGRDRRVPWPDPPGRAPSGGRVAEQRVVVEHRHVLVPPAGPAIGSGADPRVQVRVASHAGARPIRMEVER